VTELGKQQLVEWITEPCEPTLTKDALVVRIFTSYVAPCSEILLELERHKQAHQEKLTMYRKLEQELFRHPQELSEPKKISI
jgi:Virulence activator alpha C-term